jgi:hypothetical protein
MSRVAERQDKKYVSIIDYITRRSRPFFELRTDTGDCVQIVILGSGCSEKAIVDVRIKYRGKTINIQKECSDNSDYTIKTRVVKLCGNYFVKHTISHKKTQHLLCLIKISSKFTLSEMVYCFVD